MKAVSIKPRLWPHDAVDILIGLPHGLLFAAVVPLLLAWALGLGLWQLGLRMGALAAGVGLYLVFAILLLCWTVRSLLLGPDGIRFVRIIGNPKFVPWEEVEDVSPAPRSEVVRLGWLSFPMREASPALTAKGHYRLRFRSGSQYFPPKNASEFEEAVRRFREAAQQDAAAAASCSPSVSTGAAVIAVVGGPGPRK